MKKLLFSIFSFTLLFFVSDFKVGASSELVNDDPSLYEGLSDGEEVVDYSIVEEPSVEEENEILESFDIELSEGEITPYRSDVTKPVSKTYQGLVYSGWKNAGVSTVSGGVLKDVVSRERSNKFTGNLTVTKKILKAFIGFDVTYSYKKVSGYETNRLPHGRYRLQYREVHKKYKVKQERRYGGRVISTSYVYPQKWTEHQYRVVKF